MAIIHGQVVDPQGQPLAKAVVYFVSAPASMPDIAQLTDDDGKFTMAVSASGRYTVGARADNWGVTRKEFEVSDEEPMTIEVRFNQL